MHEGTEWFRWVLGIGMTLLTFVTGWFGHLIIGNKDRIADLQSEIEVLKAKPHVDPIAYTEAITKLATSVANLTIQIADNQRQRSIQFESLESAIMEINIRLNTIESDIRLITTTREKRL